MYFHPLNFIRFVLALGVVLFHYGLAYYPFNEGPLHTLILHSGFRVSFFFFISGFVMTLVYGSQSEMLKPAAFYRKRLTRILPMYWLAFIITLLLVLFVNDAAPKGLVVLLHALGLQSFYPGFVLDLNFPTWSISVELFFYALFPFISKYMHRVSMPALLRLGIFLWLVQSLQHILFVELLWNGTKPMEEFINAFPLWHLVTFVCGMSTARIIASGTGASHFRRTGLIWLLLAVLVFACLVFTPNPLLKYIHNGLLVPVFSITVIALYYDRSFINSFLSAPQVSRLGDLSYGLFIFQYPVWIICTRLSPAGYTGTTGFFYSYLAILLLFAWMVNRYFEKPVLSWLRRTPVAGNAA